MSFNLAGQSVRETGHQAGCVHSKRHPGMFMGEQTTNYSSTVPVLRIQLF